jgi:hypothetical protein
MIFLLFFLLISSQTVNCMEKPNFGSLFEEFKLEANKRLAPEERQAIRPDHYKKNIPQAHTALRSFAQNIVKLAEEKKSIQASPEDIKEFEEYIIDLREGSLGLKPIEIIDEITAIAHATSRLDERQKNSLQRDNFCLHKEQARQTLLQMGRITYGELEKRNLQDAIESEYIPLFVERKMQELNTVYGVKKDKEKI